jgi:glycosyltransferase involved in cell wall biosynthesis
MKCLVEAVLRIEPAHEYFLLLPPGAEDVVVHASDNVNTIVTSAKYYSISEQLQLPLLLRHHQIDLLHSPHFLLPLVKQCPAVATIHDVIYLSCPQDLPSSLGRMYYSAMMKATSRVADRIITDSEWSKRDIMRFLRANPAHVDVIYPGVDPAVKQVTDSGELERVKRKYAIPGDFILYTGIYKLRKNHAGLLRAFHEFIELGGDAHLVLAGPLDEAKAQLRELARQLNIDARLIFAGFVEECDLSALYSAARVYACPSLYEGFGFTVLEAMACDTPVVCAPETSLPEVAGNAAVYADARRPTEFGDALFRVFYDDQLRSTLISEGRRNLQRFQWQRAAEETLSVYASAVGAPLRKPVFA